ncbi:26S proteasome non-ATPase regulatory subunit 9 [Sphaerosporella brunnea]|uniref:Probable 26S proteasome regulatory subunit p27 n=1 Tax=Sphaerosporella brunnea TaxID=1250544 RepID=A0A5J5EIA6_9PEZI|nr:26S proteasome non-ATPase regulatory subunit 9 [Sphaerosporella brunnea]
MEDIHSPSVVVAARENQSTASVAANGSSTKALFELMKDKDQLEAELKALGSVLDSHGVNMNTSLTTFDGYPRDDIDVPQIRHTRARIIHLRNDYKDLMKRIEAGLYAHHAALAASAQDDTTIPTTATIIAPTAAAPRTTTTSGASAPEDVQTPFAKINSVAPNSPAAEAGLQKGDYIKKFGTVNALNHEKLKKLTELVAANEENPVTVLVSRREAGSEADRELTIVPRTWEGNGKLGCHILPL